MVSSTAGPTILIRSVVQMWDQRSIGQGKYRIPTLQSIHIGRTGCVKRIPFVALEWCARACCMERLCIGYHGKRKSKMLPIFLGMRIVTEAAGLWLLSVAFNVWTDSASHCIYLGLMLISGMLAAIHRARIRKLYQIEGSIGTDCVNSLCCCCCVVMQNEREVRDREELIRRHAGPATGAYVAPGQMTYAPPPR